LTTELGSAALPAAPAAAITVLVALATAWIEAERTPASIVSPESSVSSGSADDDARIRAPVASSSMTPGASGSAASDSHTSAISPRRTARASSEDAWDREHEQNRGAAGVRLVQTAYHYRSLALYAKLGFAVREPLSVLQGTPPALSIPGLGVRPAREHDLRACNQLCVRVHGHDRSGELAGTP
jgi:hypothetical protein